MSRKPRTMKTPRQRASEALAVAQRRTDRAARALKAAAKVHDEAEAEHQAALARLEYAKADPDLREDPQLPLGE